MTSSQVEPCLTCFRKTDNYLRIADETNADDVERIVTTHFWFSDAECASSVLCTSCWEKIDDFHKFYCEVKRSHSELAVEVEIKVEPLDVPLVKREQTGAKTSDEEEDDEDDDDFDGDRDVKEPFDDVKDEPDVDSDVKEEEEKKEMEEPVKKKRGRKRKIPLPKPEPENTASEDESDEDSEWEPARNDDSSDEAPRKIKAPKEVKKPRKKYAPRKPKDPSEVKVPKERKKRDIAKEDEFIRRYCPIFCDKCNFSCDTFAELKDHTTNLHNCNPLVVCCEHKFYKRSFLYQHAQYHENPDKFKCQTCSKIFHSGLALKLHLDYTHVPEEDRIHKCDECGATFAKAYHLTSHRLKHVSIAQKRFYCEQCDIAFRTNQSYKTHQHSKHGAAAKYVCDICARGFRQKSDLVTHQLTHSAEGLEQLKIQCEHCLKWMKNKKSIWTHRRICQSSGPVACDICGKMAPNPEQLKSHKKFMHQDQRVHQCQYCEKAFKRPIDLKEHETIHTGEVLYTCNFCPKTFNSNSNLYSHRRKMHPIEYAEWKLALQLKKQPAAETAAIANAAAAVANSMGVVGAGHGGELPPFNPALVPTMAAASQLHPTLAPPPSLVPPPSGPPPPEHQQGEGFM
uniref:C2H2-type domain-containing protein n=1 Tax=Culex tarsalis TaxID=7177 RepID=A0A1Q3F7E9_CULTA